MGNRLLCLFPMPLPLPFLLSGAKPDFPLLHRVPRDLLPETSLVGLYGRRLPHPVLLLPLSWSGHPHRHPAHCRRPDPKSTSICRLQQALGFRRRFHRDDHRSHFLSEDQLPPVICHRPLRRNSRLYPDSLGACRQMVDEGNRDHCGISSHLLDVWLWLMGAANPPYNRFGLPQKEQVSSAGHAFLFHASYPALPHHQDRPPLLLS